jgi:2-keto-4-pentenoate hydratase
VSDGRTPMTGTAERFVEARLRGASMPAYPGAAPQTLAEAYAIQDAAIDLWPDDIAGWKIGLIQLAFRESFGADRIAGPIFTADTRRVADDAVIDLPVFDGGFAAIEAEFVIRVARDAPADRTQWTAADAASLVGGVHVGVESAGSPFPEINDHGPAVTASDFGNNAGLIVGPELRGWDAGALERYAATTFINGEKVGAGDASFVPGGPLAALAFVLGVTAARGRPLRAGQWISTGAVTGVHPIRIGETARATFGADLAIACRTVRATPRNPDLNAARRKTL